MSFTVSLHHTHFVTNDVQKFCAFFIDNFNAVKVFDAPIDGDRNVFLKIGAGRIHLFESRTLPVPGKTAFHHIGMMIRNLHDAVAQLRNNGVEVSPVTEVAGGRFAMASGPDHIKIELFEVTSKESERYFMD